jgi:hypothetical protein
MLDGRSGLAAHRLRGQGRRHAVPRLASEESRGGEERLNNIGSRGRTWCLIGGGSRTRAPWRNNGFVGGGG